MTNHGATLQRQQDDQSSYADKVTRESAEKLLGLTLPSLDPQTGQQPPLWRRALVWPFGIGIETYRYAFMSHKSVRLEALDPMTNHDNPHNNYLYVLMSFGVLGLLAYLWLLYRVLRVSFQFFANRPQPLLSRRTSDSGLVRTWRIEGKANERRLIFESTDAEHLAGLINQAQPGGLARASGTQVVMQSADDETLQRVAAIRVAGSNPWMVRSVAFGVLTSFFSYFVYSIAGFDSVACSVFLYYLLGCAAVFFNPSDAEPERRLGAEIKRHWREFRGRQPEKIRNAVPVGLSLALLIVVCPLALHSVWGGVRVYRAERAFVGDRGREFLDKLENIKTAIQVNPNESYYRLSLANAYSSGASQLGRYARRMEQNGQTGNAQSYRDRSEDYFRRAELMLHAALLHAWAPENIFISAFQLYYGRGMPRDAELALERALQHSPHLGAVRANLAVLKLERGGYDEALKDCKWVLQVDPKNAVGHRTCGRAYFAKGEYAEAKRHLTRARALNGKDPVVKRYLTELAQAQTSTF